MTQARDLPLALATRPALTQAQRPPVVTATARVLPPYVPTAFPRLTRSAPQPRPGIDPVWGRGGKPTEFSGVLEFKPQSPPRAAVHPSVDAVFGSNDEAEDIARSLEQLASLFRGRALAALQRSLRDPVAYAVLRAIADLPRPPFSPRSAAS